jgi:hypothetical protein
VRVVPEAATSASMRSFRSAIFRRSVRMSRKISEANCRRRRAEAPCGRTPRTDACGSVGREGRERSSYPAGDEVPQKPVEAVERPGTLGHQVFAPLGKEA